MIKNRYFTNKSAWLLALALGILTLPGNPTRNSHSPKKPNIEIQLSQEKPDLRFLFPHQITNPSQRQQYLDQILEGVEMPNCSGVIYDHDGSKIIRYIKTQAASLASPEELEEIITPSLEELSGGNYGAKTPEILELSGMGDESTIFLGRELFEDPKKRYLTPRELRHIVGSHESRHCEINSNGLGFITKEDLLEGVKNGKIDSKILYSVYEIDANAQGLRDLLNKKYAVSREYLKETIGLFLSDYDLLLTALENSSPIQRRLIEGVLHSTMDIQSSLRINPEIIESYKRK